MGNSHKNHLVWNQLLNWNQTLMEQSLDGPLPNLCLAVALSHQDDHHSAVALLLKTALIQVSDYRLLGASCIFFIIWNAKLVIHEISNSMNGHQVMLYLIYICVAYITSEMISTMTKYNIISVLSRTEKGHGIFFLKRALCTQNLPKRAHRKNRIGRQVF